MLKSLSSALQLIHFFTSSHPDWGVRELAKEAGVHPAVVQRVLATFTAEDFLVQDRHGRYRLSLRWTELGDIVRRTLEPAQVVEPILHRMVQQCGESVFLSLLDGLEGFCLDIAHSEQMLRFSIAEGQRFPLFSGSHGKVILAFMSGRPREAVLEQAVQSGWDRAALEAQLAEILDQGWATTCEESALGVAGVALPVWSPDHRTIAGCLAIAGPKQRLDRKVMPHMLEILRNAQPTIERALVLLK